MIKKYIQFINEEIERGDLPEFNSWDEFTDILTSSKTYIYNTRPLTEIEKSLLDEYCKKFESGFLLTHEQINEVLLDLDLIIDGLNFRIKDMLIKVVDGEDVTGTDFNFRKEVKDDVRGILSLKRWYDEYTGVTIKPEHSIFIEKVPKAEFDNEKVYEYLEMVKETFEEMCDCKVTLDKGGPFSMRFRITYPQILIE